MIVCPVCAHNNDDFAIKCSSCGSYVQDRIPTLDFFAMLWMMIESPKAAFKKIILAEHKNYVLFLGMFLGIASAFALIWANKSGNNFDNLFPVLLFGTFLGFVICLPLFYGLVCLIFGIVKIIGGKGNFRETYGVIGWSLVPIMFSVIFILPLELATLGLLTFATNPSAYEVKPVVTVVLLGLDGLLILWSIVLAGIGLSMAHRVQYLISFLIAAIAACAVGYSSFLLYSSFNI
ncbi:MAG: YIP1 family protein [Ignavibacteriales bacterium]|nr:YIP1 family protein [Ignavibacteriales bacterium]